MMKGLPVVARRVNHKAKAKDALCPAASGRA
jgi:hypothetical protein